MTQAWTARGGKFIAAYQLQPGPYWHTALNARGEPILCDTKELALAVGRARIARINWRP